MPSSGVALSKWSSRSPRAKDLTSAEFFVNSGMRYRTWAYPNSAISLSKSATADLDAQAVIHTPDRDYGFRARSLAPRNDESFKGKHMLTTANPFDSKTI